MKKKLKNSNFKIAQLSKEHKNSELDNQETQKENQKETQQEIQQEIVQPLEVLNEDLPETIEYSYVTKEHLQNYPQLLKFYQKYLTNDQTPLCILLDLVLLHYTPTTFFSFDPTLLTYQLEQTFKCALPTLNLDKIHAGAILLSTNFYEIDPLVFKLITRLLNNAPDFYDIFDELRAEEIAAALPHYQLITNTYLGELEDKKFSESIKRMCGIIFELYGCVEPPFIFREAIMYPDQFSEEYKKISQLSQEEKVKIMEEKNQALNEIYTAKQKYLQNYIDIYRKDFEPFAFLLQIKK